jgi:UDP-N-acetyl-D-glucosamine dehydrogenase
MWTPSDNEGALLHRIEDRSARVGVVGLGYVGLPFAVENAKAGFTVVGLEENAERAAQVSRGENYISDVSDAELRGLVAAGKITATTDFSVVKDLDVIVIAVPTPLTSNLTPELRHVEAVTRQIAKYLRRGQLISLESTTYPGTTEEVMLPILESSGLKLGNDFYLAHSPERVDPGNLNFHTKNTNKVVGGAEPRSHEVAVSYYSKIIDRVVPVSSAKSAELVKVFENTFRAVNIALVNEMALLCDKMNLNVWEVLDAAFTKPFGIMPFYPGPGVGGHCIPLDPHYLEWKAREFNFKTQFISLAGEINRRMPVFVKEKIARVLNQQGIALSRSTVLMVGVSYKNNVSDCRESPAIEILRLLRQEGVNVVYHDPYVPSVVEEHFSVEGQPLTDTLIKGADLTLITAVHSCIDYDALVDKSKHVLDTRNATKSVRRNRDKITLL